MPVQKHLATITILIKDRHSQAVDVQKIFTDHGKIIIARLGVNPSRTCIKDCMGIIVLVIEGTTGEIKTLTKKLDDYYGIIAKTSIITE